MDGKALGFDQEYADWYANTHHTGRKPLTIKELRLLIANMPDEAEVKVSHQYDRHPIGIHDPIISLGGVSTTVGMADMGIPIYGPVPDATYLTFE